jgi:hypothetical protein
LSSYCSLAYHKPYHLCKVKCVFIPASALLSLYIFDNLGYTTRRCNEGSSNMP